MSDTIEISIIESVETVTVNVAEATEEVTINVGEIAGPQGPQGPQGDPGDPGASDAEELTTSGGTALDMIRVKAEGGFEYRTAAQVLSDIGAAASGHAHDIAALAGAAFDSGELPVWDGVNFVPSFFSTSGTKNLDVPLLTNIRSYLSELDTPVTLFQLHPNYIDIYKRLNVLASAGIHSFSSQALMLYGDTTVDLLANDTTQMRIDDNASAVYTPLQLWSDAEGGLDRIATHNGMLYYYNQGTPTVENLATLAADDSLFKASSNGVVAITSADLLTLLEIVAGANNSAGAGYRIGRFQNDDTVVDMGYTQDSAPRGYGADYVDGKALSHSRFTTSQNDEDGAIRLTDTGFEGYVGGWLEFVTGFTFRENDDFNGRLEHKPANLWWVIAHNGNSVDTALNGSPFMQAYSVDMGAYPT